MPTPPKPPASAAKKKTAKKSAAAKAKTGTAVPKAPAASPPRRRRSARGNALAPRGQADPSAINGTIGALPEDLVQHYGQPLIALILQSRSCPPEAPLSAVARLLRAGQRLGMDPLEGDVYLAAGSARNGSDLDWAVVTKRDALLKYAERQRRFRGHDEDAVYSNDEFRRVAPNAEGKTMRERAGVAHTYNAQPGDRGDLVGAWCLVETANQDGSLRPPTYFFAALDKYQPDVSTLGPDDPWKRHPDACVIKAAQLWALRNGLGLTDIVGQEELERLRRSLADAPADAATTDPESAAAEALTLDYPDTPEGRDLAAAVTRARELHVPGWPDAKLRGHLLGLDATSPDGAAFLRQITGSVLAAIAAVEGTPAEPEAETREAELERLREQRAALETRGNDVDGEDAHEILDELGRIEARIAELTGEPVPTDLPDPDDEERARALVAALEGYQERRGRYEQIRSERKFALDTGETKRAAELEKELTDLAPDVMAAAGKVTDLGGDPYATA